MSAGFTKGVQDEDKKKGKNFISDAHMLKRNGKTEKCCGFLYFYIPSARVYLVSLKSMVSNEPSKRKHSDHLVVGRKVTKKLAQRE